MNAIRSLFAPMDMTVGSPWKKILLFMIPMLIGNIAQQLYNTVDSVVVGNMWVIMHWLLLEARDRS